VTDTQAYLLSIGVSAVLLLGPLVIAARRVKSLEM